MSSPRNRKAYERGQRRRALIRAYLLDEARAHPFARRPSWKQIQAYLRTRGHHLERSHICRHVQQIELEATLLELERSASASSHTEGQAALSR